MADIALSGLTNPYPYTGVLGDAHEMDGQEPNSPNILFPIELGNQGGIGFRLNTGPGLVSATTPNPNQIVLEWDSNVTLNAWVNLLPTAAFQIVPPLGGGAVEVLSAASLDPNHVVLTTTDQKLGETYELNISAGVVTASASNIDISTTFDGNNSAFAVASHRVISDTQVLVTFNRAAEQSSAQVTSNYVFAPSVALKQVTRISDVDYLVIISGRLQPGQNYLVTVSNVKDQVGNTI
jgi:hypothetical protein